MLRWAWTFFVWGDRMVPPPWRGARSVLCLTQHLCEQLSYLIFKFDSCIAARAVWAIHGTNTWYELHPSVELLRWPETSAACQDRPFIFFGGGRWQTTLVGGPQSTQPSWYRIWIWEIEAVVIPVHISMVVGFYPSIFCPSTRTSLHYVTYVFSRNVLCPLIVSAMWPWLQARGWMEQGAWKVIDSFNERHSFTLVKTGITTGNSRDISNTTCDALSSWSLDPMLSGAVWLKINLEKLVCTLVSWLMFQVTVALPSGYSEKFSIEQSSTVYRGLEASSAEKLSTWLLEACGCRPSRVGSYTDSARSGTRGRRPLHSYCPGGKASGSSKSFCIVLPWRWPSCHMGRTRLWWWQLRRPSSLLNGVQQVQATNEALAALLADGSVVTWGEPDFGGDSSEAQDQLKGVQQVQANDYAFAAILADESVVTWGFPDSGGDSSDVQDQLKGVQQVQATSEAFAAILADGSIVTWGRPDSGGDSSEVQDQLKGVQRVQANCYAFAAILADESVVTWGFSILWRWKLWSPRSAERCPAGSSYKWGICCDPGRWVIRDLGQTRRPASGGDSSEVQDQLKGVQQIQANCSAFAAILADESVVTWGFIL